MSAQRRKFLQAVPVLAAMAAAAAARAATTDLVLACDTTLARPLRAAAAAFAASAGVTVHVFSTPPGLILPQLERDVQNDIVVSGLAMLEDATSRGIIGAAAARAGIWRNRLVLAARRDARPASLGAGPIAVNDFSPASGFDGRTVLTTMGMQPNSVRGVLDTDEVLALLASGDVQLGLLHTTDLGADSRLEVLLAVPDDAYPPIVYGAAVTRLSRRPNPDAFVRFLATDAATALLRDHGLGKQS